MDIVQEARAFAVAELDKYNDPPADFMMLAERKVVELAKHLHANVHVAQVGYYFMDLKLSQALQEKRLPEHVAMSVAAANRFLDAHKVTGAMRDKIINCIAAHHKDIPFSCIEAEIVANSDCYKFIHPRGFLAYLHLFGKRGDFLSALGQAEKKLDEKWAILSLDVCKKELEGYYHTLKKFCKDAREFV